MRISDWSSDVCSSDLHGKEEGLLFPAMIEAGLSADGGPISVMLSEHEQGRALVAAMANATEPAMSPAKFSEAAAAYADHMRAHKIGRASCRERVCQYV